MRVLSANCSIPADNLFLYKTKQIKYLIILKKTIYIILFLIKAGEGLEQPAALPLI